MSPRIDCRAWTGALIDGNYLRRTTMRIHQTALLASAAALLIAGTAQAQNIQTGGNRHQLSGDKLFEFHGCVNCHGAKGRNPVTKKVPQIGGKDSSFIYQEATAILAGKRDSEDAKLMHSALSYHQSCDSPPTDAELRSIASWLSTQ
jgi:cytochrome c553